MIYKSCFLYIAFGAWCIYFAQRLGEILGCADSVYWVDAEFDLMRKKI